MVVLGRRGLFLMSEAPLYCRSGMHARAARGASCDLPKRSLNLAHRFHEPVNTTLVSKVRYGDESLLGNDVPQSI